MIRMLLAASLIPFLLWHKRTNKVFENIFFPLFSATIPAPVLDSQSIRTTTALKVRNHRSRERERDRERQKQERRGAEKRRVAMVDERRVGVAVDFSTSSKYALRWTLDNLVRERDHLVIVVVNKDDDTCSSARLWRGSGSPLIPLHEFEEAGVALKYGVPTLDPELFSSLDTATREKNLVVVIKVYWGDAREKLCDAINHIPLDSIVVGNRGLGSLQRLVLGSVSSYLVNNASCPVTVVKPSSESHSQ